MLYLEISADAVGFVSWETDGGPVRTRPAQRSHPLRSATTPGRQPPRRSLPRGGPAVDECAPGDRPNDKVSRQEFDDVKDLRAKHPRARIAAAADEQASYVGGMARFRLYVFDLDGTLVRGKEALPHAVLVTDKLRAAGAQIRYLTNNSSHTTSYYHDKLTQLGFTVNEGEIYSSGLGAALHLSSAGKKTAFIVGMPGLVSTVADAGITVVNRDSSLRVTPAGHHAEVVVAGLCLDFTYDLMAAAMDRIRSGAAFVATNTDATFPLEGTRLVPGAGSIVAGIELCSGKKPFVIGKPNPYLIQLILRDTKCSPQDALVVGDRLETDIAAGTAAGCHTHLVLTGVTDVGPPGQSTSSDLLALIA
jgi:4-nitrophenyl phosphatase